MSRTDSQSTSVVQRWTLAAVLAATAILMLEWDQGETVEISLREFKMYVENEWGWRRSFAENTGSYSMQYRDDD